MIFVRHRQPFFTSDTARVPARAGDARGDHPDGQERRRGRPRRTPSTTLEVEFIPEITAREAIQRGLKIMDSTALSLVHGQPLPDRRLQHGRRAQHRPDSLRRAGRNAGEAGMIDEPLQDAREHMAKSVDATRTSSSVRTGQREHCSWTASPSTTTGPRRRSSSSPRCPAPEARLLTVQPYDKKAR